jgi:uncharacterized protein (UPF0264 family)
LRLLISVRSGAEAKIAAGNGADIVDAKEPGAGPLGAVGPEALGEILRALPGEVPLGVALGDVRTEGELELVLERLAPMARRGPVFLKLGFAGVPDPARVTALLRAAGARAGRIGPSVSVVAAAYADHHHAGSPSPDEVLAAAAAAAVAGVLVDTWGKDGRSLLDHVEAGRLRDWVRRAHRSGLLAAAAGSLGPDAIPALLVAEPDIVGVRGAACRGGRGGPLDPVRVRRLRAALDRRTVPAA